MWRDLGDHDWDPIERAALAAVDETADDGCGERCHLGRPWPAPPARPSCIELLMVIAHYLMLTTVLRSLRVELEPRAVALAASVPAGPAACGA